MNVRDKGHSRNVSCAQLDIYKYVSIRNVSCAQVDIYKYVSITNVSCAQVDIYKYVSITNVSCAQVDIYKYVSITLYRSWRGCLLFVFVFKYMYIICIIEGSVPNVHTTQTTIVAMTFSNVTLECPYTSLWPITNVKWQRKTANGTCVLNHSKDTNVYDSGTINHPELVVYNMQTNREGTYRCFVSNKFGIGSGNDITLNILSGFSSLDLVILII
jgi:hypothetical protein